MRKSAAKEKANKIHKERFVSALFEHYDIGIAQEFATFYKKTRTAWIKSMSAKAAPLPENPTTEDIRQHGLAERALQKEVHINWRQMMDVLQLMMRYSLPTYKAVEIKGSTAQKAVFNINIGGPPTGPATGDFEDADDIVDVSPSCSPLLPAGAGPAATNPNEEEGSK